MASNQTSRAKKAADKWVYVGTTPTALDTGHLSFGTELARTNSEHEAALEAAGLIIPQTPSKEVAA